MKTEITAQATYSTPPVVATGFILLGLTLNEWVAATTIFYVALQAAYLGWKWYGEYKAKRANDAGHS